MTGNTSRCDIRALRGGSLILRPGPTPRGGEKWSLDARATWAAGITQAEAVNGGKRGDVRLAKGRAKLGAFPAVLRRHHALTRRLKSRA